jgi:hypothetical protein
MSGTAYRTPTEIAADMPAHKPFDWPRVRLGLAYMIVFATIEGGVGGVGAAGACSVAGRWWVGTLWSNGIVLAFAAIIWALCELDDKR